MRFHSGTLAVGLATLCGAGAIAATVLSPRAMQVRPAKSASAGQAARVAQNAANDAAPGQLTILNEKGEPAGLCPLKKTDVNADVAGFVARVTVRQAFHNPSQTPIEAIYTFPLPSDAAVDDMTMTIGNRVVRGQIKKREEAREIYETAKAQGKAAALLDQERPNIFTQAVANIMPGEAVTITISYVHLLKYDDGEYEFHFPMVVGPRYIPASAGGGPQTPGERGQPNPNPTTEPPANPAQIVVNDPEKIAPPITPQGTRAGHNISLSVKLDAGLPLREMRSTLHEVNIQRSGMNRALVSLKGGETIPNKDFILKYRVAGDQILSGLLTHAPGNGKGGYFTLIMQPPMAPIPDDITPKEMVFVIDQTGSQSGWPIEKAKETMRYCLQNLNPDDTFQLLGFNTQVFPCFPKPVRNTRENVAAALKFLEPIEGRGGTDILKALDFVLNGTPDDPNRLRIVCYMTDGLVGNDMQILDAIGKWRRSARMFPFGVGNSVNRFLIDGMAVEGKGVVEYVTLQDDGKKAAEKFYRRIAKPLLMDVSVDWGGLPVEDVYPKHLPDLFTAGPIILKGRYTQAMAGEIVLSGRLRGKPWSQRVRIDLPARDTDGSAIATLWAREKIEDLQRKDWMGAQLGKPDPTIKDQITATALEFRLMSQFTSFVAVEERVINRGGNVQKIDVPVEMPEGMSYEGIFGPKGDSGVRLRSMSRGAAPAGGGFGGLGGGGGRTQFSAGNAGVIAPGAPAANAPAAPAQQPKGKSLNTLALKKETLEEKEQRDAYGYFFAEGDDASWKRLQDMKPEDRKKVLAEAKLHELLQGLPARIAKEGKSGNLAVAGKLTVKGGKAEVQIAFNALPKDGLAQLKALGFELTATLTPGKLVLGWIPANKLDALIELRFVRRVSPPLYR